VLTPVAHTGAAPGSLVVRGPSTSRTSAGRAVRGGLLGSLLIVLLLVTGCTSSGSSAGSDGDGSGSCARRVEFNEQVYRDVANVDFTTGDRLGEGSMLACDDTGGQGTVSDGAVEMVNVFEIQGLDSSVAIAIGDTADTAEFFALDGKDLPDAVRKFIDS